MCTWLLFWFFLFFSLFVGWFFWLLNNSLVFFLGLAIRHKTTWKTSIDNLFSSVVCSNQANKNGDSIVCSFSCFDFMCMCLFEYKFHFFFLLLYLSAKAGSNWKADWITRRNKKKKKIINFNWKSKEKKKPIERWLCCCGFFLISSIVTFAALWSN